MASGAELGQASRLVTQRAIVESSDGREETGTGTEKQSQGLRSGEIRSRSQAQRGEGGCGAAAGWSLMVPGTSLPLRSIWQVALCCHLCWGLSGRGKQAAVNCFSFWES